MESPSPDVWRRYRKWRARANLLTFVFALLILALFIQIRFEGPGWVGTAAFLVSTLVFSCLFWLRMRMAFFSCPRCKHVFEGFPLWGKGRAYFSKGRTTCANCGAGWDEYDNDEGDEDH